MSRQHTRKFIEAILRECSEKHSLHPMDSDLNGDYHAELTFSVQELRNLLIENGDCWDWRERFAPDDEKDGAPLGISELVSKIGDENITVQNLMQNMTDARQLKDHAKITFATSKTNGQQVMRGAAGIESDVMALVLWFPKAKLPT